MKLLSFSHAGRESWGAAVDGNLIDLAPITEHATLAAFIGAGGLGDLIAAGLALSDTRMILSGALPAAALALVVDAGLGLCERAVQPGG